MEQYTQQMIKRLNIKGKQGDACVDLSGGNQQKSSFSEMDSYCTTRIDF